MNKLELIERYIQNKVNDEERDQVRRLMDTDADFKAELTFQLELREAVVREESSRLKQRLQSLEQQAGRQEGGVRMFSVLWKVAAVLVVGLGLLWFFNKPADWGELYANNFEPYPNIVAPVVRDVQATGSDIEQAFRHYDSRAYADAAAAFDVLRATDTVGFADFYYAISLMAQGQTATAVQVLENPDWETPENYQSQTDWYLALGYLKLQNREKAVEYLDKTIANNGAKASQARKILSEIE